MKHVTNIVGGTGAEDLSRFTFEPVEPVKRVRLVRREPAGDLTIVLKCRNVGQRQGKVGGCMNGWRIGIMPLFHRVSFGCEQRQSRGHNNALLVLEARIHVVTRREALMALRAHPERQ